MRALIPSPKLRFALSTSLLDYECFTKAKRCVRFNFSHQSLNWLLAVGGFLAREDVFDSLYMCVSYLVRLDAWLANNIPIAWPWPPQTVVLRAYCTTIHEFLRPHNPLRVVQHTLAAALGMNACKEPLPTIRTI
ncbi:hypothetical protein Tco_1121679 [Tanacetum coccineum]|uniref:Uncharacterized protein n=1 Tax=Tanacetum coccineum TaxID=301880 RepID=A0ABQ5J234_9ASTR